MIEQICAFIHNYFVGDTYAGTFTITDGTLTVDGLLPGQYFRIRGSRLNDGVYIYPASDLADETFTGYVDDMRPPRTFLNLVTDIEAWQSKYGEATTGPYQSESFGGYSYTLKSGTGSTPGAATDGATWRGVFATRLNQWRKLC